MKGIGRAVMVAPTTGATAAVLAGCTTGAPSSAQSQSAAQSQSSAQSQSPGQSQSQGSARSQGSAQSQGSAGGTHAVSPAACKQQYETWQHGWGKGLVAAVTVVGSASASGNSAVLAAALKEAKPALSIAARYPMPMCADPKGYWMALLMHVNAAEASTSSATRLAAAVKGIPEIANGLLAELKHTGTAA